ncbi:MarR family transcriptional regulator [Erysipelothrix larvae]|uniref:MarR family transcriptional regulator n=1 Tax=Erysipelothrix larvae TaxID=1514105 RepID=A0A0X8GZ87_9FIRM|nr:winged helix DNA-binding protein [Erysipelothrix larvae]AMC93131.1 MarR family transcriptional regulator [Erysipelothrix larvae]
MDKYHYTSEQISLFCRMNIRLNKNLPIRSSETGLLIYLVKTDFEKTPKGVAQFFMFSKSMATNMVTSLVSKGYLEKIKSDIDKRSIQLTPTDKAIHLVNETYESIFDSIVSLRKKMGDVQFDTMIDLIATANSILTQGDN